MATPLLLYLSHAGDAQRFAVGPVLAAAAERAGWEFECYYGALRLGRHFGGGDPERAPAGWPNGSLVAGGRHLEQAAALADRYDMVALGDPECVLWPALDEAETLARTLEPRSLYEAAFERLGQPLPSRLLVLDAFAAPYLYPAILGGEPALAREASGAGELDGWVNEVDQPAAPRRLGYAELTSELARRHRAWGRGVIVGDPALVAAQLPRARRLRLLPLYGRPQVDALEAAGELVRGAAEPVWGRQYDDRDFFTLGRLGRGFQLVDPDPPFDAARGTPETRTAAPDEPGDEQLAAWADDGRVLATLLLWSGMVRELDCLPRLVDVVARTGVRAGLVLTVPALELAGTVLAPLAARPDRGGVLGHLEPLLASTGRGVCAETLMPDGALAETLRAAREEAVRLLPSGLEPRGWWPLLDAPLVRTRTSPVALRGRRPVLVHRSRLVASAAWRARLSRFVEERRPFERERPGALDVRVPDAVRAAGFEYMWTKTSFGRSRVAWREGDFVVLSLTAGNWDGWSPFYTVGSRIDVRRAERRLGGKGPGWLVGTIDAPLWALSGEVFERGRELVRIAERVAAGGGSGEFVNVTPNVVARYARLLDERGLLS